MWLHRGGLVVFRWPFNSLAGGIFKHLTSLAAIPPKQVHKELPVLNENDGFSNHSTAIWPNFTHQIYVPPSQIASSEWKSNGEPLWWQCSYDSHRIHVWYICLHRNRKNQPFMQVNIPVPWILWDWHVFHCFAHFFLSSRRTRYSKAIRSN